MSAKPTRIRLLVWILLNLFLIVVILYLLSSFNIWDGPNKIYNWVKQIFKSKEVITKKIEDPLLLKEEELKKWEMKLKEHETLLKVRELAINESNKSVNQVMLKLQQKSKQLRDQEIKILARQQESENEVKNIKDLAEKLRSMPPKDAVNILEGLDSILIIKVFRQMDKDAEEAGTSSVASYYLSIMKKEKAQEIFRLKAKLPVDDIEEDTNSQEE
ncbi:MAG: hypothetical protein OEV44_05630 [Spirochaetota bacterium]|nr:hypothetical protein [Spirochaetota bacterium]